ncbi:hypothetical protein RIF29_35357 [Crotalaria pallida]|uniref:Uncharacterized protein n=1 Tax=Crotalaria pallida TaxID=3830 RepID=A0AAN9E9U5_CROPI
MESDEGGQTNKRFTAVLHHMGMFTVDRLEYVGGCITAVHDIEVEGWSWFEALALHVQRSVPVEIVDVENEGNDDGNEKKDQGGGDGNKDQGCGGSGDVSGGGNKVEGGGPSVDGGVSGFGNDVQEEVCSGSESDSENDSVKGVHFDDSEEERDLGVDDAFEVELGGELGLCGEFGLGGGVVAGSIEENGGSVVAGGPNVAAGPSVVGGSSVAAGPCVVRGPSVDAGPNVAAASNIGAGASDTVMASTAAGPTVPAGPSEAVGANVVSGPSDGDGPIVAVGPQEANGADQNEGQEGSPPSRNYRKRKAYKHPVTGRFIPFRAETQHEIESGYNTDELESGESDSDDDGGSRISYPKFREEEMGKDFKFKLGMEFSSLEQFKDAILEHSVLIAGCRNEAVEGYIPRQRKTRGTINAGVSAEGNGAAPQNRGNGPVPNQGNGAAPQNGGNGPVSNQGNGAAFENQGNGAASQSHVHAEVNLGAENVATPIPVPSPVPVPIPVLAPASQPPPVVAPVVQPNPVLVASAKGKGASAAKGKGKMVVASFPTKSNSKMVTSSQPAPTIHAERPKRVVQSRYMKPFAAAPVATPAATPAVVSQNNAPTNGKGIASSAPKGKTLLVSGPKGKAATSPKNPKVSEIPHGFTETARTRKLVKAWGDVTQSYNELKKRRLEDKK